MTSEEIAKGNELCASFMKISHLPYNTKLQFHSNWNWLMKVVEKIESIQNSDDYEIDIFGNCCSIGLDIESVGKSKIEATFKAVVKFIESQNFSKEDSLSENFTEVLEKEPLYNQEYIIKFLNTFTEKAPVSYILSEFLKGNRI